MRKYYVALYYTPLVIFLTAFLNPFGSANTVLVVLSELILLVPLLWKIMTSPNYQKMPWHFAVMMIAAMIGIILLCLISRL